MAFRLALLVWLSSFSVAFGFAKSVSATVERVEFPEIGTLTNTSVGGEVYIDEFISTRPTIELKKKVWVGDGLLFARRGIHPDTYALRETIDGWDLYYPEDKESYKAPIALVGKAGGIAHNPQSDKYKVFTEGLPPSVWLPVRRKKFFDHTTQTHRYGVRLIYKGKEGDILHFRYHEKGLVHTTPTNIALSLNESRILTHKNISIEVIKVTAESIGFRILDPKPELPAEPTIPEPEGIISTGTGFFITTSGHLLTNFHVVEGAKTITVTSENKSTIEASLIYKDEYNDLALLKIDASTAPLSLDLGQQTRLGSEVFTMGHPMTEIQGSSMKVTFGRVNSRSGIRDDIRFFQIDVPIQPGNSGGPLLNNAGNVIGITTLTLSPQFMMETGGAFPQNVNYALKINYAGPMVNGLDLPPTNSEEIDDADLIEKCKSSIVLITSQR